MNLNKHSQLEGRHAFLSPSKPAWLSYDVDKLTRVFHTSEAAKLGTAQHEFAAMAIALNVKLPDNGLTLSMYVNDAIGYHMTPEQTLFGTRHCFGTADAIGFRNNTLRVHDLKTGTSHTSMNQLEIYAALFCMEYGFDPFRIDMSLKLYQSNKIVEHIPTGDEITHVMEAIKFQSKLLDELTEEVQV
jgi:hypothetical protein